MNARNLLLMFFCALVALGCESFDGPPQTFIVGIQDGILADPEAPLVIAFHEPVDTATLSVKLIIFKTNGEGELPDEDADPNNDDELELLYERDTVQDFEDKGTGTFNESRTSFTIVLEAPFPVGPQLAVVIESGLKDDLGHEWKVRQVIKFGFEFQCSDGAGAPTTFPSDIYFMVVDVDKPLSTQILLWCDIRVNPQTGDFVGQFSNADRDPSIDCSEFGLTCGKNEVCRTLPSPTCVLPSENAGTPEEYPDFYANVTPPEGYTFTVKGCIVDQPDGSYRFANEPANVEVQSPPVTVEGVNFNSSWAYDGPVLRGSGTFTAKQIYLGDAPSGAGVGTHTERSIPADEVPDSVPAPPGF